MSIKLFNKKVQLVTLIIVVHLTFSYYFIPKYWSAGLGFVLIIVISYLTWNNNFTYWTGIRLKLKEVVLTAVFAIVFLSGSFFLIRTIAEGNSIQVQQGNYKDILHTFFYSLNEEIIMGALLLKGIKHRWGNLNEWKISIGVALIFSVIHFVFFKWIFLNTGNLNSIILLSLFCVGIIRNNLILKTGHIGYSWAIHFGWVFPMLGCAHFNKIQEYYLSDFERFEIYMGDNITAIVAATLAISSFLIFSKKTIFF